MRFGSAMRFRVAIRCQRVHLLFFLWLLAFALAVLEFTLSGINSFCPICNLCGSSMWLSDIRSLYGTFSFFAIDDWIVALFHNVSLSG